MFIQDGMRTIQMINVRWFNATSWYAVYLAALLEQAGHETLVLTLPDSKNHDQICKWELNHISLPLNSSNPFVLYTLQKKLTALIHDFKPDVVNCHRGEGFWLWGYLRLRYKNFALIRTRGDQRLPRKGAINRWLHNTVADAVISTNSVTYHSFLKDLHTPEEKLHLILGGVDKKRFVFSQEAREKVRADYGFEPGHMVVGIVGRFADVKGQRELIQAVAMARQNFCLRQLKLLLVGFSATVEKKVVEHWIEEVDLKEHAFITGHCENVAEVVSAFDLGVVASKSSETIARAALEIMSCHIPLISTTVGVMPDLLHPEALFPPADVTAMAGAIKKAADPLWRQTLASRQRKTLKKLGGEDFLEQTLAVYTKAIGQKEVV